MKKILLLLIITTGTPAATIVVNTTEFLLAAADDGKCTMHEAIAAANDNVASGATIGECVAGEIAPIIDIIEFDAIILPAHIDLADPIEISESVEIRGPGRDLLSFTNQLGTRVFKIQNTAGLAEFFISDLSLINNVLDPNIDTDGGALYAIISADTQLTLNRLYFDNNRADSGGGAVSLAGFPSNNNRVFIKNCQFSNNDVDSNNETLFGGGAVLVGASLNVKIENSTFLNNAARNTSVSPETVAGGAILIRSNDLFLTTASITNSTFSNNRTTGRGGAVAVGALSSVIDSSEVTIKHSTFTKNKSDVQDQETNATGGAIFNSSTFNIQMLNTIVAENSDNSTNNAPDLTGNFDSLGYNLIGDNSTVSGEFPSGQPNINNDLVGDSITPLDPLLTDISNNGGPTLTHMPMSNSVVVDHGKCDTETADQRNFHNLNSGNRIFDNPNINNSLNGCDIGAIELDTNSANPVPDAIDDNYQILEGQSLLISVANGLLSNDTDNNPLIVLEPFTFDFNTSSIPGMGIIGINGDIQFVTNNLDTNGQAQLEYSITDQSNKAMATMHLDILPVNDAPSFTADELVINAPLDQFQTLPEWASEISVGPINENSQTASFIITTIPVSGFFSKLPKVNFNTGDLTFTISNSASGIANVSVVLKDSGGTSNGGQDFSTTVDFTIEAVESIIFKNGFE